LDISLIGEMSFSSFVFYGASVLSSLVAIAFIGLYLRYKKWIKEYPIYMTSFREGTLGAQVQAARKAGKGFDTITRLPDLNMSQMILPFGIHRFVSIGDADWADYVTSKNLPKFNPVSLLVIRGRYFF
jgi:hypothetical protein